MEIIKDGVVFSNDINLILNGKNALKFNYQDNGMIIPDNSFIEDLRSEFERDSIKAYERKVRIISEEEMSYCLNEFINIYREYFPIVSMDEIYVDCDNKQIFSLDCCRMSGQKKLVTRQNPLDETGVFKQVEALAKLFKRHDVNEIILADDVVFTGSIISQIRDLFKEEDIEVIGVISSISTEDAYVRFNKEMKYGLKCGYLMKNGVLDEICERDFYFGIAQSGMNKLVNGEIYKAPYFLPFGNPVERASLMDTKAEEFSKSCRERSAYLWEEIEKNSNKKILVKDLPERILNTNEEDEVVRVLRKVR